MSQRLAAAGRRPNRASCAATVQGSIAHRALVAEKPTELPRSAKKDVEAGRRSRRPTPLKEIQNRKHVCRIRCARRVGINLRVGDDRVGADDEESRYRQHPTFVVVVARQIDIEPLVDFPQMRRRVPPHAELRCNKTVRIDQDGKSKAVESFGSPAVRPRLLGDNHYGSSAGLDFGPRSFEGLEREIAVRTPKATMKGDNQWSPGQQIAGLYNPAIGIRKHDGWNPIAGLKRLASVPARDQISRRPTLRLCGFWWA